jgi:hypothetical protein
VDEAEVVSIIFELRRQGIVEWDGSSGGLAAANSIRYVPAEERDVGPDSSDEQPSTSADSKE